MVAAFALGALSFGFAGKMAGPFFEAAAPGFAPAPAAAAPTASKSAARNPLTPQGPSAASAPAVAPATDGSGSASVKVPAARPDRVESANTQATNTQAAPPAGDLAGAPRRTDANATETDGRETPPGDRLAERSDGSEPRAASELQSGSDRTEAARPQAAPPRQAARKSKPRHVAKQYRNEWANTWRTWQQPQQQQRWGFARDAQWRPAW